MVTSGPVHERKTDSLESILIQHCDMHYLFFQEKASKKETGKETKESKQS